MDLRNLKYNAKQISAASGKVPNRLVLVHCGVTAALSVALVIISLILDQVTVNADGLSGLGVQAALSTAQSALELLNAVIVPFWAAGLTFAFLGVARQQSPALSSLTEGFRRFRPVLGATLLQAFRYLGVCLISMYVGSMLFMLTPYAAPMQDAAMELMQDPTADVLALPGDDMTGAALAYLACFLPVFLLLAAPIYYRFRMIPYLIMDSEKPRGIQALMLSQILMRGHRMELLRLDLSFWWFYLPELLTSALSLGDLILYAMGIPLPISEAAAFWFFLLLSTAARMALYLWAKPTLETTYALYYEALRHPPIASTAE